MKLNLVKTLISLLLWVVGLAIVFINIQDIPRANAIGIAVAVILFGVSSFITEVSNLRK